MIQLPGLTSPFLVLQYDMHSQYTYIQGCSDEKLSVFQSSNKILDAEDSKHAWDSYLEHLRMILSPLLRPFFAPSPHSMISATLVRLGIGRPG